MHSASTAGIDFSAHRHPNDPEVIFTPVREVFEAAARHPDFRAAILQRPEEEKQALREQLKSAWAHVKNEQDMYRFRLMYPYKKDLSELEYLPQVLLPAKQTYTALCESFFTITGRNTSRFSTIANWRTTDGDHEHSFPVLNTVVYSGGTVWPKGQVDEGDWIFMKPYFPHAPEHRTNQNKNQPRITLVISS